MKKSFAVLAVFFSITATAPTLAQDAGPFISATTGQLHSSANNLPANFTADDTSTSWALGGGYRFNQYVGIEAGYRDFGKMEIRGPTTTTTKGTAWTYGGFISYPLADRWEIAARAGWFRWQTEVNNATLNYHATHTGTEPYWGTRLAYSVSKTTALSLNWMRFKSAAASRDDADVIEVGLQYRF